MTTYRLGYPTAGRAAAPELDEFQRSVVEHPGGPLLVLAGPGTGKTTTLVEAIVDRIEHRGAAPDSVLALTFSRKAAEQLRDRVTARLGRTMATTLSSTFHSFAYGLVRRYSPPEVYAAPLRLLTAPEQDVILQRAAHRRARVGALARVAGCRGRHPRLRPRGAGRAGPRPGEGARLRRAAAARARGEAARAASPPADLMRQYVDVIDSDNLIDYPDLIAEAVGLVTSPDRPEVRADLRRQFTHVFVDEYQDTDPSQVALLQAIAGDGRNLTVVGDPDQSIYALPRRRGARHPRLPRPVPSRRRRPRADVIALRVTRRFGSRLLTASRSIASSISTRGAIDRAVFEAFRSPDPADNPHGPGRVEVRTYDTARAETEHIADVLRRAHLEDGIPWSEMAVLVRSGRTTIPPLRRSLGAAGVPVEVAADDTPLVREPAVLPLLEALRAVVDLDVDDPDAPASPRRGPRRGAARLPARRARRRRRAHARPAAAGARARPRARGERTPRSSPVLLRDALLDPTMLAGFDGRPRGPRGGTRRPAAHRPGAARRRRHRRGGPLGAVGGHRLATAAAAHRRGRRRSRPDGPPRPRRALRPVRGGGPGRGAARAHQRRGLPRHAHRAADPGRHARRARGPR